MSGDTVNLHHDLTKVPECHQQKKTQDAMQRLNLLELFRVGVLDLGSPTKEKYHIANDIKDVVLLSN